MASTNTSQRRCHNCSCGTNVVEIITRYRKRIETLTNESLLSITSCSTGSIPPIAERTSLPDGSPQHVILTRVTKRRSRFDLWTSCAIHLGGISRKLNVPGHTVHNVCYIFLGRNHNAGSLWRIDFHSIGKEYEKKYTSCITKTTVIRSCQGVTY
jgi:hypothetical protein